ncbi:MAG: SDR family oxidoreductase [Cytophagaceae bacterium]|nr:SDR family oxidoreductase [Cytophagaceae bacterium]
MNTKENILITGATGNVGSELIKFLKGKNVNTIAGVKDPEKKSDGIDLISYRLLDFEKPETFRSALSDIDKVFLIRPPHISNVKEFIFPFIDAASDSSVKEIVFLSLMGVENNKLTPHYKIEKYIKDKKIPYTFLRPSFFMQNLSTTHKDEIRNQSEIFVPAGKGKTSFIDVRDIAEIGMLALIQDGHINKAYELSGKEALNYYEVAEILSAVLNKKVIYADPNVFSFFFRMKKNRLPIKFILIMIALYTVCKLGLAGKVTFETKKLLGRDPITFRKFAEDYRNVWT